MIPIPRKAIVQRIEEPPAARIPLSPTLPKVSTEVDTATTSDGSLPDALEAESLMLNIDASLRVHARTQFFSWTQGLLQNMIKHELLICALRNGEPLLFHVDSFASSPVEPAPISELFRRDTLLIPHLIKAWEDNSFRPASLE